MSQLLDAVSHEDSVKVADLARTVIRTRKEIATTVGAMLASRQLYAMALHELNRQLERLPLELRHELLGECLIQSAANQAGVPFSETELLAGFTDTVFPWLTATCDAHVQEDANSKKQQQDEREQARRLVNIPLPFSTGLCEENSLTRSQTLVLVGWRPVVNCVLDLIEDCVLQAENPALCLLHLDGDAANVADLEHSPKHYVAALSSWSGSCASAKSFGNFFVSKIAPSLSCAPDVTICGDLSSTVVATENVSNSFQRDASKGHKRLREWSKHIGCAFIGAIPLEEKMIPDFSPAYWDELKHWSCLRAVWVRESKKDDRCYDVYLGQNTFLTTVHKEEIDS